MSMLDSLPFPRVSLPAESALSLSAFREMDEYAVAHHQLPIELMMENAGLHLARLVASLAGLDADILIGVGNGNNGGGGLVAARRLAAWGYSVSLDSFTEITRKLPARQLARALALGVEPQPCPNPAVWVDAYLGFSQRLPLSPTLLDRINRARTYPALRVSLDLPTGFQGDTQAPYFQAQHILTLAAPKQILYALPPESTYIYLADLGIPEAVYQQFGLSIPPFHQSTLLHLNPWQKT